MDIRGTGGRRSGRARRRSTVLAAAVVVGVTLLAGACSSSAKPEAAAGTTASTVAGSVAGRPCVATSDPLPAGAPDVPVEVGPAPTTLVVKDLAVGSGATVNPGDTVTVNYIGVACSSGKIFDSTYARGQTISFPLASVIKGWTNGIPNMKVGGVRLLGIPSDQAYGSRPPSADIAPDEALWFVVQVTAVAPT